MARKPRQLVIPSYCTSGIFIRRASVSIAVLYLLGTSSLVAQRSFIDNLIKNPGFEEYKNCPSRLGSFDRDVRYWSSPTQGSTDYFSGCSRIMTVPSNYNGHQQPRNGKAYAGMYLWAPQNYREYIQVGLRKRLLRDSVYQLKLSISLAERSRDAVGNLGFLFTDRPLNIPIKTVITSELLDSLPDLQKSLRQVVVAPLHEGSTAWEDVEFHYRARGFERYLVVGNFRNDSLSVLYTHPQGSKPGAYYYLDRLTLFGVEAGRPQPSYRLDTTYVFKDILFEFDRYEIDSTGQEDLRNMYYYLRERPDYHIYIAGHTDGLGKDRYNQELALKRARRIAEGLSELGIASHRIHVEAYGSLRPVAPNQTDTGRQLNRRAEFVLRRRSGTQNQER